MITINYEASRCVEGYETIEDIVEYMIDNGIDDVQEAIESIAEDDLYNQGGEWDMNDGSVCLIDGELDAIQEAYDERMQDESDGEDD